LPYLNAFSFILFLIKRIVFEIRLKINGKMIGHVHYFSIIAAVAKFLANEE